eukprot:1961792-Lingulodinium_polyedra.AAC.1
MAMRAGLYGQLSPEARASYEAEACTWVHMKEYEVQGDTQHTRAELDLKKKRFTEETLATGLAYRVSACALSATELVGLQALERARRGHEPPAGYGPGRL